MMLALGMALWAFAALAFTLACRVLAEDAGSPTRRDRWIGVFLLLAASALLFRPEEILQGGEDPGAYINSAFAFSRHGAFSVRDPALAALNGAGERASFFYGHGGFLSTKDACLWVKDADRTVVGPWFQPAYPVMMSVPVSLGFRYGAFLVAPLLALGAAALVGGLARRAMNSRPAAALGFVLFLLHPAEAWNARCPRAEVPAVLFALSGLVLLIACLSGTPPPRRRLLHGVVSGLSLSLALTFHVTALYLLLPCALAVLTTPVRAGRFRLGWCLGAACGAAVFAAQLVWVTDCYFLLPKLRQPSTRGFLLAAAAALLAGGLAAHAAARRTAAWLNSPPGARAIRLAALTAAGGYAAAAAYICVARQGSGAVPGLPGWLVPYLSLTDVRGAVRVSSIPLSLAALAGLGVLAGRSVSAPGSAWGRWAWLLLAPASLTAGWMENYMFETRRLLLAWVPLTALAATAAVTAVAEAAVRVAGRLEAAGRRVPRPAVLRAGVAALCGAMLAAGVIRGREPLYRTWNRRGAWAYYEELATELRRHADVLFAEYTQTAAPLDHVFGFPLLPLASDYRTDAEYSRAEKAMRRLVTENPTRRYVLVSPFDGAAVSGLAAQPLFERELRARSLTRARRSVPQETVDSGFTLRAVRLRPPTPGAPATPYVRRMDGGRLGAAGLSVHAVRNVGMDGQPCSPGATNTVSCTAPPGLRDGVFCFVFAVDPHASALPDLGVAGVTREAQRTYDLGPGWRVLEVDGGAMPDGPDLHVTTSAPVHLADVLAVMRPSGESFRILNRRNATPIPGDRVDIQWLRARAWLALPVGRDPGLLWMLATNGRDDGVVSSVSVSRTVGRADASSREVDGGWRWHVWPLPATTNGLAFFEWFNVRTTPGWNPKTRGFPADLGLRVERVAVTP